jgi:hypothetical protein
MGWRWLWILLKVSEHNLIINVVTFIASHNPLKIAIYSTAVNNLTHTDKSYLNSPHLSTVLKCIHPKNYCVESTFLRRRTNVNSHARIHSLQINIFGLERISTLPEKYLRQKEIYVLPAKILKKYQNFTEDISFVQEGRFSVQEENYT